MSMARAVRVLIVASLLVTGAGGCGGGGQESGNQSVSVATTGGGNERLTESQWQSYQEAAKSFGTASAKALSRLKACPVPTSGQTNTAFKACVGDSLMNLEAETESVAALLTKFGPTVKGACLHSLGAFLNYATPYAASLSSLQQAIDSNDATLVSHYVEAVTTTASNGREARASFESDCSPP
jgi:hypothetical protein